MNARTSLILASGIALSAAAAAAPAESASPSACTTTSPTYDTRQVECRLGRADPGAGYRFRADFAGGHDDTSARLEPFLDDAPTGCDAGSKLQLFAEDGNVSLWCDFAVTDRTAEAAVFKVTVRWSHAQYVGFELAPR